MNSFRSLEKAVEFEIDRQIEVTEAGGTLVQETRHWDESAEITQSMRSKEGSSDYRYFTEPDLVPMVMDGAWVSSIRETIPELPAARRQRYRQAGLDDSLAGVLSDTEPELRSIYESATAAGADPTAVANWVTGEITAWMRRTQSGFTDLLLDGQILADLLEMVDRGALSSSAAKEVLDGVLTGEGSPEEVAASRDLIQISDSSELELIVDRILAENADALVSLRSGEDKVLGFLVGQVMRASQGKADPKLVNEILRSRADR